MTRSETILEWAFTLLRKSRTVGKLAKKRWSRQDRETGPVGFCESLCRYSLTEQQTIHRLRCVWPPSRQQLRVTSAVMLGRLWPTGCAT